MLLLIVIKHVCQNILRVFQSFSHFCIVAVKSLIQRHSGSFALFVYVGNVAIL